MSAGALPAGTSLNSSSGLVSGTPTAAGGFSYTIKVTDSTTPTATTATQSLSGTIALGANTITFPQTTRHGHHQCAADARGDGDVGDSADLTPLILAASAP